MSAYMYLYVHSPHNFLYVWSLLSLSLLLSSGNKELNLNFKYFIGCTGGGREPKRALLTSVSVAHCSAFSVVISSKM